jgi:hypothetical protein
MKTITTKESKGELTVIITGVLNEFDFEAMLYFNQETANTRNLIEICEISEKGYGVDITIDKDYSATVIGIDADNKDRLIKRLKREYGEIILN